MPFLRYLRSLTGPDSLRAALPYVLIGFLVIGGGVYHAITLRWLSDDIFITFRYIDQWFGGNGLVYNPGEYVEGYTHPLWLLLLSGWRLMGGDMISGSMLFGIIAQGLLILTLVYASWKMAGRAFLAFPAAAAAVALHHDASVWASSGLETGLFAFLVTLSVVLLTLPGIRGHSRMHLTGSVLVLATLTRPDGALFLIVMAAIVVIREWSTGTGRVRRRLLEYALPSTVFIPYALWKLFYYGNLLPNTYYAKSGGGFYFERGWTYIRFFVEGYPSTVLVLLALAVLVVAAWRVRGLRSRVRQVFSEPRLSLSVTAFVMTIAYLIGFVARVGGDFMYARFIVPVVPLIYLSAEASLRYLAENRPRVVFAGLVAIPLFVGTVDRWSRNNEFTDTPDGNVVLGDGTTGIVDEHWFWTRPFTDDGQNAITMLRGIGERLHTYFDGLTVRILIRGQACLAYYSKANVVIENWGLTDPYIAHLEIRGRGRVGHEKAAPMEYIVSRRIHFFFFKDFTPSDTAAYRIVRFDLPYGWSKAEMHFYDRELMSELGRRYPEQIRFVDFEKYLDQYVETASGRSWGEIADDFASFKVFYFNHNFDPEREKRFADLLRTRRGK